MKTAEEIWNDYADGMNQWRELDIEEKEEFASLVKKIRREQHEATKRFMLSKLHLGSNEYYYQREVSFEDTQDQPTHLNN